MTNESYRTAYVYVSNRFAGVLKETDNGYSFIYDADSLITKPKPSNCFESLGFVFVHRI